MGIKSIGVSPWGKNVSSQVLTDKPWKVLLLQQLSYPFMLQYGYNTLNMPRVLTVHPLKRNINFKKDITL